MKELIVFFAFLTLISCGSDDEDGVLSFNLAPSSGLLGQSLIIPAQNLDFRDNIQVFFGTEEANFSIQETQLRVTIPRTLKEPSSELIIIDLNTNETIALSSFTLLTPAIDGYSVTDAAFGEVFTILGTNFDINSNGVEVLVNGQTAEIQETTYTNISILLPGFINSSELEVEVRAQRQTVIDTSLNLKAPELFSPNQTEVLYGDFVIEGIGLNPENLGNVYVDDVEARFNVYDNSLIVNIPPGIYNDFIIQEIRYEYAGFTSTLEVELIIIEDVIVVDQNPNVNGYKYVYENNIYGIGDLNGQDDNKDPRYGLYRFVMATEKWERVGGWEFEGGIKFNAFDNEDRIYLQKTPYGPTANYEWSYIDLNTFEEVFFETPISERFSDSNVFAFQSELYVLGGLIITPEGNVQVLNVKLKLDRDTLQWEELPSDAFKGIPLPNTQARGRVFDPRHANGKLYLSQFDSFAPTLIVNEDFSVSSFNQTVFVINGDVLIANGDNLKNLDTGAQIPFKTNLEFDVKYLNDTFYYTSINDFNYFLNEPVTVKLNPILIDGIF